MKKGFLIFVICLLSASSFYTEASRRKQPPVNYLEYAKNVANAEMSRNSPSSHRTWNYKMAFLNIAYLNLYEATKNEYYYNYVKNVADRFIDEQGFTINTFNVEAFDLRNMLGGNFVYDIFYHNRDIRYTNAMTVLRRQLHRQPRVQQNRLFWFSQANDNEVWLDGFYTAMPFYCLYAAIFNETAIFSDIVVQIRRIDERTLDPKTGLNFQAWNESRTRIWADRTTGTTQALFAQSIGFYMMALVDILDYFPVNHDYRDEIIRRINRMTRALEKHQDSRSGMWFQVVDMPRNNRNFLEASSTAMFAYAIAKSVNNGYLPKKDRRIAERAFQGLIDNALENDNITKSTTDANLNNGNGTFDFYVNLPQRTNEPNAIAAFILAAVELAK